MDLSIFKGSVLNSIVLVLWASVYEHNKYRECWDSCEIYLDILEAGEKTLGEQKISSNGTDNLSSAPSKVWFYDKYIILTSCAHIFPPKLQIVFTQA